MHLSNICKDVVDGNAMSVTTLPTIASVKAGNPQPFFTNDFRKYCNGHYKSVGIVKNSNTFL